MEHPKGKLPRIRHFLLYDFLDLFVDIGFKTRLFVFFFFDLCWVLGRELLINLFFQCHLFIRARFVIFILNSFIVFFKNFSKYVCSFFAGFNLLGAIVLIVRRFFYYFLFDDIGVFEFLEGHFIRYFEHFFILFDYF